MEERIKITESELINYSEEKLRSNLDLVRIYLEDYLVYPQKLYLTNKDNKQCVYLKYNERKYYFFTDTYNFNVVECVLLFLEQIEEKESRYYIVDDFKKDMYLQNEENVKITIARKLSSYMYEELDAYEKRLFDSLKFDYFEQFEESEEIPTTFISEWVEVQPLEEICNLNHLFDNYILNA